MTDYSFVLIIIGGISMMTGWIIYHFFNVIFDESIKFVILGIALMLFSFIVKGNSAQQKSLKVLQK